MPLARTKKLSARWRVRSLQSGEKVFSWRLCEPKFMQDYIPYYEHRSAADEYKCRRHIDRYNAWAAETGRSPHVSTFYVDDEIVEIEGCPFKITGAHRNSPLLTLTPLTKEAREIGHRGWQKEVVDVCGCPFFAEGQVFGLMLTWLAQWPMSPEVEAEENAQALSAFYAKGSLCAID